MKQFVTIFFTSSAFGFVIGLIYWYSSHDKTGTFLLGLMGVALAFAATYALLAEREALIPGDEPERQHKQTVGENLGIVTKESPWPILLAISIAILLFGVVWSDFLIFTGIAAMLLILWRLSAESSRI